VCRTHLLLQNRSEAAKLLKMTRLLYPKIEDEQWQQKFTELEAACAKGKGSNSKKPRDRGTAPNAGDSAFGRCGTACRRNSYQTVLPLMRFFCTNRLPQRSRQARTTVPEVRSCGKGRSRRPSGLAFWRGWLSIRPRPYRPPTESNFAKKRPTCGFAAWL